ncbi:MAG TPA: HAMP domain-containing sensor histidine kinase [Puia sp.]|nr:HAMP domain-containing sensor histidine kinase [Puia sp.]
MNAAVKSFFRFQGYVKHIGYSSGLDGMEKRKLGIFNLINFFGLSSGIIIPLAGLCNHEHLPAMAWVIACSPALISLAVLTGNHYRKYEMARMCYFILYPVMTSLVYAAKIDAGVEFFFILYGVLSVFFLKNIYHVIFSFSLSMAGYFLVCVVWKDYQYRLEATNYYFYLFNRLLAIGFIFYGLFLIRTENTRYQLQILNKNRLLHRSNLQIHQQKTDIVHKAGLLEEQTRQLTELNILKNKLFSVIAHDLKSPMYALRNLFRNIQQYDIPAGEIKMMIPEVVKELGYTTGLMDNLLQWAKCQMQVEAIRPQVLDISKITREVLQLLRLQAEAKRIYVSSRIEKPIYVYADKDMIDLVLRNLLSNAIKFTPEEGTIFVNAREERSFIEVTVEDTGTGISQDNLKKLMAENYYTTKGTGGESGTGLGLMLCKDFLARNGGRMHVTSEPGKGSTFSFTLPKGSEEE